MVTHTAQLMGRSREGRPEKREQEELSPGQQGLPARGWEEAAGGAEARVGSRLEAEKWSQGSALEGRGAGS